MSNQNISEKISDINNELTELKEKVLILKEDEERYRLSLVCCGVAAQGYFTGSKEEYMTDSLKEVLKLYEEYTKILAIHDDLVWALEKLACLGNGNTYGNSDGNNIARRALAKIKGR